MAPMSGDLNAVQSVIREETRGLATKDDLTATEHPLTSKAEVEAERFAQITVHEFRRLHRRAEALARHVGYAFEAEIDEGELGVRTDVWFKLPHPTSPG